MYTSFLQAQMEKIEEKFGTNREIAEALGFALGKDVDDIRAPKGTMGDLKNAIQEVLKAQAEFFLQNMPKDVSERKRYLELDFPIETILGVQAYDQAIKEVKSIIQEAIK